MEFLKILFNLSALPIQQQAILIARFTIITISIQFVTVLITLAFQLYLKYHDVKIESRKLKAKKLIKIYQKIYSNLETIERDLPGDPDYYDRNIKLIKKTRKIVSDNGLYFSSNALKTVSVLLDNLTVKIATPGHNGLADYNANIKLLKKEFDKA